MTVKDYFGRVFETKKNAQFYLFHSESALNEALRVIFCETHTACGACSSCELLHSDVIQDVLYLRSENGSKIKDESVEEAIRFTMTEPTLAYRVVALYDAEKMTERAQNRLLKSLESPSEHVIYLMATAYPYQLLTTVLSRAIKIHLQATDENTLTKEDDKCEDGDKAVATLLISGSIREREHFFEVYRKDKEKKGEFSADMERAVKVLRRLWHEAILAENMNEASNLEKTMLLVDDVMRNLDQNGNFDLNVDRLIFGGCLG